MCVRLQAKAGGAMGCAHDVFELEVGAVVHSAAAQGTRQVAAPRLRCLAERGRVHKDGFGVVISDVSTRDSSAGKTPPRRDVFDTESNTNNGGAAVGPWAWPGVCVADV